MKILSAKRGGKLKHLFTDVQDKKEKCRTKERSVESAAQLVADGKLEKARIQVEGVIREENAQIGRQPISISAHPFCLRPQ